MGAAPDVCPDREKREPVAKRPLGRMLIAAKDSILLEGRSRRPVPQERGCSAYTEEHDEADVSSARGQGEKLRPGNALKQDARQRMPGSVRQ